MIELRDITIAAGEFRLGPVSMAVQAGRYAVLMGRTGCGKSSIIECIAGLRRPAGGRVLLEGRDVTDIRPADRGVGYVPQDGALFPTMTVADNLQFALRVRGAGRRASRQRAAELADMLGIGHLLDRGVTKLSGGEQQRVALGRALAFRPRWLLLDEPLSAVDEDTREEMYDLLRLARRESDATVLHVTHNPAEAAALADVQFEIRDGALRSAAAGV
jgi:ABC-type sugar transport system ATPase subunit